MTGAARGLHDAAYKRPSAASPHTARIVVLAAIVAFGSVSPPWPRGVAADTEVTCGQLAALFAPARDAIGNEFKLQLVVRSNASERPLLARDTHVATRPTVACMRDTILLVAFGTISGHELALAALPDGTLLDMLAGQLGTSGMPAAVPDRPRLPAADRDKVPAPYRAWFDYED
jgi:hypothetical protein